VEFQILQREVIFEGKTYNFVKYFLKKKNSSKLVVLLNVKTNKCFTYLYGVSNLKPSAFIV